MHEHDSAVASQLLEEIEAVAPGDCGWISQASLNQDEDEFASTMAELRDLERAGVVRLGAFEALGSDATPNSRIEFERMPRD